MKEELLTIFNHYEPKTQRNKLCEEFRELQDELHEVYDNDMLTDNLVSEIADNFVLMLQFAYDNEITLEEIKEEMEQKIERQLKRIENEKNKTEEIEFIIDENNRVDFRQVLQMINMYEEKIQKKQTIIDKAIKLLGNYKHYSTPDEKQNSANEDLVNNAFDILKEAQNEKN